MRKKACDSGAAACPKPLKAAPDHESAALLQTSGPGWQQGSRLLRPGSGDEMALDGSRGCLLEPHRPQGPLCFCLRWLHQACALCRDTLRISGHACPESQQSTEAALWSAGTVLSCVSGSGTSSIGTILLSPLKSEGLPLPGASPSSVIAVMLPS